MVDDPNAMMLKPTATKSIVIVARALIFSPSSIQLNMAVNIGIAAKIKTTFATLVLLTANTNAGEVDARITHYTHPFNPIFTIRL